MAPRAALQQGIELLKIHQLRRENAAIYQQIQNLRDVVTDMKEEQGNIRTQTQKICTDIDAIDSTIAQHSGHLEAHSSSITTIGAEHDELNRVLSIFRESSKVEIENIKSSQRDLKSQDVQIREQLQATDKVHTKAYAELVRRMTLLDSELYKKVDRVHFEVLRRSLDDLVSKVKPQAQTSGSDNVVLVHRSVETQDDASQFHSSPPGKHTGRSLPNDRTVHNQVSETASVAEVDLKLTLREPRIFKNSSLSEDIDLDENANKISYAGHGLDRVSPQSSLVMLPQSPLSNRNPDDTIQPMEQQQYLEGFNDYLQRFRTTLQIVPIEHEVATVHQFIDGLVDKEVLWAWSKWLDATSWTWKSIDDAKLLFSPRLLNVSAALEFGEETLSQNNEVHDPKGLSEVIVNQLSDGDQCKTVIPQNTVNKLDRPLQPTHPRRSQRIAELNALESLQRTKKAAPAVKASKFKQTQRKERKPTSKRIQQHVVENQSESLNRDSLLRVIVKPQTAKAVCTRTQPSDHNSSADQELDCINDSSLATPNIFCARTPQRNVAQQKADLERFLNYQHLDEVSPSRYEQAETFKAKSIFSGPTKPSFNTPSPYNPQPQLVPSKRKTRDLINISDTEELELHNPALHVKSRKSGKGSTIRIRPDDHNKDDLTLERPRKRRSILPPPPPIPILSTSTTEEDRERYNRWHSP